MTTMDAGQDHQARELDVSEAEARAELDRLLEDPRFHATDRAKKVLYYIAEAYFKGQTGGVKAYAIALDVLGRSARFDPNTDPIVRIELSRLRSALSAYYEAYGSESDIGIQLPIGRYLTVFSRSPAAPKPREDVLEPDNPSPDGVPSRPSVPKPLVWISAIAAVGLICGWLIFENRPEVSIRPLVTIKVVAADERYQQDATLFSDYLVTALSKFRTLSIVTQQDQLQVSGSLLHSETRPSYHLELKYYVTDNDRSVWWQAVDATGGKIQASGLERVALVGRQEDVVRDEIISILARKLAPSRGIISNLEALGEPDEAMIGNVCVLRAEFELEEGSAPDVRESADCLERTLERQPTNSDAAATLARTLLDTEEEGAPEQRARAHLLARQSVSLDPMSDRANIALMMAQFRSGNIAPAIAAGERAMRLNPENPDVLAKLSTVLFCAGQREVAISLARDAATNVDAVPRDAHLVLALDAYHQGDFSNASLIAEQISRADIVILALKAAALGEMRSPIARERLETLAQVMPDYETALMPWMDRHRFDRALTTSLQRGLQMAKRAPASTKPER